MPDEQQQLRERLEGVERSYRRVRRIGFASMILVGGLVLMGVAKPKSGILEGRSLVVRDEAGTIRARVEVKDDSPGIALYDKKGNVRSEFSLGPDGSPGLCLYDEDQLGRVLLEKGYGDSWSLGFYSKHGKNGAILDEDYQGNPHLRLFDKDGKLIWSAP